MAGVDRSASDHVSRATSPDGGNQWTQEERMEAEIDAAGDAETWIEKDMRDSANSNAHIGQTSEVTLAPLGPESTKQITEQRGEEGLHVYSVVHPGGVPGLLWDQGRRTP